MKKVKVKYFVFGALTMFLIMFVPKLYRHYVYFKLSKYPIKEAVQMLEDQNKSNLN